MKNKKTSSGLWPGSIVVYVIFLLFAAAGLYFSVPYGLIGIALCVLLRAVTLRGEGDSRRMLQNLMENVKIDGGEVRESVTKSPLPTVVALATTGEIVWANDQFIEISGNFSRRASHAADRTRAHL